MIINKIHGLQPEVSDYIFLIPFFLIFLLYHCLFGFAINFILISMAIAFTFSFPRKNRISHSETRFLIRNFY